MYFPLKKCIVFISFECIQVVAASSFFSLFMLFHCSVMIFFIWWRSGLGCSKLTTSLVNISLKFQTLISEIFQYFLLKKCEKLLHCSAKASLIFSTKNISVFGYKVVKHLTS